MWKVVFVVKSKEKALTIKRRLEDEYIIPKIVERNKSYEILVEETDLEDADDLIRTIIQ